MRQSFFASAVKLGAMRTFHLSSSREEPSDLKHTVVARYHATLLAIFGLLAVCAFSHVGFASTLWVTNSTSSVYEFDGTTGAPVGNFTAPGPVARLAQFNGDTYLLDRSNGSVYEYDSSGKFVETFISGAQPDFNASAIVFGSNGDLSLTLQNSNQVVRYSSSGAYLGVFGNGPTNSGPSGIHSLAGLAFSNNGDLYVADFQGQQIVVYGSGGGNPVSMSSVGGQIDDVTFNSSGTYYYSLSNTGGVYAQDGAQFSSCATAGFARPRTLAFESDGNLYFACQDSGTIDRVNGSRGGDATVFASGGGLENALDFAFLPYTAAAVPEVSTATLGGLGFVAIALIRVLRKRQVEIA